MAVLSCRDLSFEFRYTGFLYEWVEYHFRFLWKGEPMVRDEVLVDGKGRRGAAARVVLRQLARQGRTAATAAQGAGDGRGGLLGANRA